LIVLLITLGLEPPWGLKFAQGQGKTIPYKTRGARKAVPRRGGAAIQVLIAVIGPPKLGRKKLHG
jgi:hypothetical protein